MTGTPTLYLLDASSFLFRAFHSTFHGGGTRLTTRDGFPTNALFVFTKMLLKLLNERTPSHMFAVFDVKGGSFRNEIYKEYKAHRPPPPPDLVRQFEPLLEIVQAMGVPVLTRQGFEADDLIATLTRSAREAGYGVVVVSGDKDLAQLVGEGVTMLDTLKEVEYGPQEVRDKWGVWPNQVRDLLALMGDASDNVPGVAGVGEKTARKLLLDFGSLDNAYARLEDMRNPRLKDMLERGRADAELSRTLVTLKDDVPLEETAVAGRLAPPDHQKLHELFSRYEFTTLLAGLHTHVMEPVGTGAGAGAGTGAGAGAGTGAGAGAGTGEHRYVTIDTVEALDAALDEIRRAGVLAIDTETDSLDVLTARLVGVSLACRPDEAWYVPLGHRGAARQLSWEAEVRPRLQKLLNDPKLLRVGHNLKFDSSILLAHGLDLKPLHFDTMVASYLLNPERMRHNLEECARAYLNRTGLSFEAVAPDAHFELVDVSTATQYSGEDADLAASLQAHLAPRLEQQGLSPLFRDIEMPLVSVLAQMERTGIRIDPGQMRAISREITVGMQRLEREIYELAGGVFTINSPKQLGEILFVRLKLPTVKKTKTGFSTDVAVLEELADQHPLPAKVLSYRHLSKLQGTYVDVLPNLIHPRTGRIHTSYNQCVTGTGRLSSSDPNLQNIPVRTELGRRIRQAFIPAEGCLFVGADYSQIELRVLAHLSGDASLIDAFVKGEDIHTRTACELFGVAPQDVTRELRGRAKTINFGVLYGMSAFRLARELGIPRGVAAGFIDHYFSRYPGIRRYLDRVVAEGREHGFVTTLLGRRRWIPDLRASDRNAVAAAERVALNTPIQGTAADVIKKAMVEVSAELERRGLQSRMVLQVHDELLLEVPEAEVAEVRELVQTRMEGVLRLDVPLQVDLGQGPSWGEAHS
jgi:DNA polymerase-1